MTSDQLLIPNLHNGHFDGNGSYTINLNILLMWDFEKEKIIFQD